MTSTTARLAALATALLLGCGTSDSLTTPLGPDDPSFVVVPGLNPPSNVTATAASTSRADLAWQDNATSETGFEIQRSLTGATGTFTQLATLSANVTTYADQGLTAQTQYCYRIRALQAKKNATNASAFSSVACATTPANPPTSPAVASVTVLPDSTLVIVGGVWGFRAEVRDASGALMNVAPTWTTSDAAIATVSATGATTSVAKGVARGRAVITATAGGVSGSAKLTVLTPVRVTTTSTGNDLDPTGMWLTEDGLGGGSPDMRLTANGTLSIGIAGQHELALLGLAPNCSVVSTYPVIVNPSPDFDTVVNFDIRCTAAEKIAYAKEWYDEMFGFRRALVVDFLSGSDAIELWTDASEPTWSPDGSRLAYGTGTGEIAVWTLSTNAVTNLTSNAARDWSPAWSPDGARIAFATDRDGQPELYVMNADGSAPVRITNGAGFTGSPAWSPDGARIAFDCEVDAGNADVCVVDADGSGFARLTSDAARDAHPAWSPDGQRIAFDTDRYASGGPELALLSPSALTVSRFVAGMAAERPAWSADGTRLAFTAPEACDWGTCPSVQIMAADGSGYAGELAIGTDAAWRPRSPGP